VIALPPFSPNLLSRFKKARASSFKLWL